LLLEKEVNWYSFFAQATPNISDNRTNNRNIEKYLKGLDISSLKALRLDIKLNKIDESDR
jgi:hypothetical protein